MSKRHRRARLQSDPLTRGDLAAVVSTRSHRAPFFLMPSSADEIRTRLHKKLTVKGQEERRSALNKEELRSSQIRETNVKMEELETKIAKGTGLLRDVEEVIFKIWAQSFSEGTSQDERDATLDRLDRQRVTLVENLAEWNESANMLQDFLNKLYDDDVVDAYGQTVRHSPQPPFARPER